MLVFSANTELLFSNCLIKIDGTIVTRSCIKLPIISLISARLVKMQGSGFKSHFKDPFRN